MRSLAPYTRTILKGIYYCRGLNSTFTPLSRAVNTNAERLHPRCRPSPQPADILVDIPADIPANIPSASRIKTSKEKKVDIIKDLLRQQGWPFYRLVSKYLESENGHKGNKKKKKVGDLLIPLLEDKEIQEKLINRIDIYLMLITYTIYYI